MCVHILYQMLHMRCDGELQDAGPTTAMEASDLGPLTLILV
jgi:hypothetical protein